MKYNRSYGFSLMSVLMTVCLLAFVFSVSPGHNHKSSHAPPGAEIFAKNVIDVQSEVLSVGDPAPVLDNVTYAPSTQTAVAIVDPGTESEVPRIAVATIVFAEPALSQDNSKAAPEKPVARYPRHSV